MSCNNLPSGRTQIEGAARAGSHPKSYRGWDAEFQEFLKQLHPDDVFVALHLTAREAIARKEPAIDYEASERVLEQLKDAAREIARFHLDAARGRTL